MKDLRNKSFLTLLDFSRQKVEFLLTLLEDLRRAKYIGTERSTLKNKNIALLFEKDSIRACCTFEVAAYDQGVHVAYLGPTGSQIGEKEAVRDTACVLGGMYNGIEYRGFSQRTIETLAQHSGVPVWNRLTDEDHPTQMLADFLTTKEILKKKYANINFIYVGDGRSNVANALIQDVAIMDMNFHLIYPKELNPTEKLLNRCERIATGNGDNILIADDIDKGVKDSDVVYIDIWVSMGEPGGVWQKHPKLLEPYQINQILLRKVGNPNVIFEHYLPSFHNAETRIGQQIYEKYGVSEVEITNDIFESKASVVL